MAGFTETLTLHGNLKHGAVEVRVLHASFGSVTNGKRAIYFAWMALNVNSRTLVWSEVAG